MKGNISATQVAIFGNMSTDPELEICAEPADGFHKALSSCTNKQNKTNLSQVSLDQEEIRRSEISTCPN